MLSYASYRICSCFKLNRITEGHGGCTISLLFCFVVVTAEHVVCMLYVCRWATSVTDDTLWQSVDIWDYRWNSTSARRLLQCRVILLMISLLETGDIWSCESWSAWMQSTTKSTVYDFSKTNTCEQRSIIRVSDIHSISMLLSVIIISPIVALRRPCT